MFDIAADSLEWLLYSESVVVKDYPRLLRR